MIIYISDKQSTLPALVAAKQLAMNAAYPEVIVHKFVTASRRILITVGMNAKGDITERWEFEDSGSVTAS